MCKDMGGYRYMSTFEGTGAWVHKSVRIEMCEDVGGYRYERTWEDEDM